MARGISQSDLEEIVSYKSNITKKTFQKISKNFFDLVLSELQNNSYIHLKDFGNFSVQEEGGKEEWFLNPFGVREKRYVPPRYTVVFEPNKSFIELLNGKRVLGMTKSEMRSERANKAKYDNVSGSYETYVDEMPNNPIDDALLVVTDRRTRRRHYDCKRRNIEGYVDPENPERNKKKVYCITNSTMYDSIAEMADALGIDKRRVYYATSNGKDEVCGYKFKIIPKEKI